MLTKPQRVTNAINNRITVALPITSLDIEYLSKNLKINVEDLRNIDTTGLKDGALLAYDEETKTWKTTTTEFVVDGGWR